MVTISLQYTITTQCNGYIWNTQQIRISSFPDYQGVCFAAPIFRLPPRNIPPRKFDCFWSILKTRSILRFYLYFKVHLNHRADESHRITEVVDGCSSVIGWKLSLWKGICWAEKSTFLWTKFLWNMQCTLLLCAVSPSTRDLLFPLLHATGISTRDVYQLTNTLLQLKHKHLTHPHKVILLTTAEINN